jgi:hypothetical protein
LAMEVGGFNVLLCDKFNTFEVKLHDTTLQALYATHPLHQRECNTHHKTCSY